MTSKPVRKLLGQLGLTQVRHVSPAGLRVPPAPVGQVYEQVEREFGVLAPPLALHSPAPGVLAASWVMLRETLIVTGQVDRAVKEAVSTTVSLGNACPFCITVHNSTLAGLTGLAGLPRASAMTNDPAGSMTDPRVRAAVAWAQDSRTEEGALRHEPPCPASEAPELIGTAVMMHYLNRMVNIFLGEVPLPPRVPKLALRPVMRILGGMIQTAAREPHPPGTSLDMLPPASAPADLSWASGDPVVSDAFARACAAIDAAGARSAPAVVRDAVLAELACWRGETRGPSRAWVEDAVSALPAAHRAAGKLALLTAFASYQVDRSVIDEFRLGHPADSTLVELTSWASLAAARRAATWIPVQSQLNPRVLRKHNRKACVASRLNLCWRHDYSYIIPFADGHVRKLPLLTSAPFRYHAHAADYLRGPAVFFAAREAGGHSPSALSLPYPPDGIPAYSQASWALEAVLRIAASEAPRDARVFVGVTDPIDPRVETPEEVRDAVLAAARVIPAAVSGLATIAGSPRSRMTCRHRARPRSRRSSPGCEGPGPPPTFSGLHSGGTNHDGIIGGRRLLRSNDHQLHDHGAMMPRLPVRGVMPGARSRAAVVCPIT